jgi:phthalate 4,5-cis-dihydrodiol dehydrogenase
VTRRIRLGIAGLGRAFTIMLPTLRAHPRVELVAAADPRIEAGHQFSRDFPASRVYPTVAELCADPGVDAIYVATPHDRHAAHAIAAAAAGKHLLVEKPMAVTLEEARDMEEAARKAGVVLVVGPSHSFDAPIVRARELIATGAFGAVRMITALNFTDFLYRPRRPEELATDRGGGVIFSQAAHQVDVVRLLAGSRIRTVRAITGSWDAARPTEGAYSALLCFENGAFASLTYSGYAHFDSDELMGWVGELGQEKDEKRHGAARRALSSVTPANEAAAKAARNYGGASYQAASDAAPWHEHFGLVVVSCEKADLRPMPNGVQVYAGDAKLLEPLDKPAIPRAAVIDELCDAIEGRSAPLHDARWGRDTLEACRALLRSSLEDREVAL